MPTDIMLRVPAVFATDIRQWAGYEPSHPVVLALSGVVPDFTLTANPQGVSQSVMGLAFIQPDLSTTLHIRIEQTFDDEKCSFDLANFTKGKGQLMLARVWGVNPGVKLVSLVAV